MNAAPKQTRGSIRLVLFLVLIGLVGASPAFSAGEPAPSEPTTASTKDSLPKDVVRPIPVDQIGVEAERTKSTVAELQSKFEIIDEIALIKESLPDLTKRVEDLLKQSEEVRERDSSLVDIDQLRVEWKALITALRNDQEVLSDRAGAISDLRDELREGGAVWQATLELAQENSEEKPVLEQITDTLNSIETTLDSAKRRQADLSTLQGNVARLVESTGSDMRVVDELRQSLVGRFTERDRYPFWADQFLSQLSPKEITERLEQHRDLEVAALKRFVSRYRDGLVFHAIVTILLIIGSFYARARIGKIADENESLGSVVAVFKGPVSLGLLISGFIGFWFYEDIPPLAGPVLGAGMLLPAVLVLRRLLERPIYPILYLLLGVYVVGLARDAVAPLPNLPRGLFVMQMLAIILVIVWWRRPSRLATLPRQGDSASLIKWLSIAMKSALVLAPAAIVAEVSGYTVLSSMLGGVTVTAGNAGVILYGAVRGLDGLYVYLLQTRPFRVSGMIRRNPELFAEKLRKITRWAASGLYVFVLLRRLNWNDDVIDAATSIWGFSIPLISVTITIGSIIEFFLVLWITFGTSRFIRFALEEEVYTRVRMVKGKPYAVTTLTHYIVLFLGFILAVFALGIDVNRFTVLAGAFGVGVGFGLQTIVNNFVSGIILLTERPVQVGDTVQMNEVFGVVERIGIRSSTVRTWQGAEVIVPNADLVSQLVTNWTLSDDRRRVEISVGVSYGTDPDRVIELLKGVAAAHDRILEEPAPTALFMAFGENALEFELRCWTDDFDSFLSVRSDLTVKVARALADEGIRIPFPQRDLHIHSNVTPTGSAGASESQADSE